MCVCVCVCVCVRYALQSAQVVRASTQPARPWPLCGEVPSSIGAVVAPIKASQRTNDDRKRKCGQWFRLGCAPTHANARMVAVVRSGM